MSGSKSPWLSVTEKHLSRLLLFSTTLNPVTVANRTCHPSSPPTFHGFHLLLADASFPRCRSLYFCRFIPHFPFLRFFFIVRIHYVFCSSDFVHHLLLTIITNNSVPRTRPPQTPEYPAKRPRLGENETLRTPLNMIQTASLPTQGTSCISHLDCSEHVLR